MGFDKKSWLLLSENSEVSQLSRVHLFKSSKTLN